MEEIAQEKISEKELVNAIFNEGKSLEDFNKTEEVINTEDSGKENTETVDLTKTETTEAAKTETTEAAKTETVDTGKAVIDEPFFKKRGFESEAALDTFLESAKKPKEPEYKTTLAKEYEAFVKATGVDDFSKFNFFKTVELKEGATTEDYLELLAQKQILDNPSLAGQKEGVIEMLKEDYLLDMDKNHASAAEKAKAAIKEGQLKTDAEKIAAEIKEMKEKISNNGVTQKEIDDHKAKIEVNKTQWEVKSKKIADDFKLEVRDFETNDKGEEKILDSILKSYTFTQDVKDFHKTAFDSVIAYEGFPELTDDGVNKVREAAQMATVYQFFPRLLKEAMAQTEARIFKEYNIERDNPSSKKEVAKNEDGSKVISEKQATEEAFGLKV